MVSYDLNEDSRGLFFKYRKQGKGRLNDLNEAKNYIARIFFCQTLNIAFEFLHLRSVFKTECRRVKRW